MIELVIFDMAGTSINEDNLVYKTVQKSLKEHGFDPGLDMVLEHGAGKEKWQAIADIVAILQNEKPSDSLIDEIHADFKTMLNQAYDNHPMEVFPSVLKVMDQLKRKQIKIAYNTGYSRPIAEKILSKVGIVVGEDIDMLITADDVKEGRPGPEMIDLACNELNIEPSNCIKIGDSGIDIEEGRNAKVKYSIGITTGAQTRTQLERQHPDYILDDMLELMSILEKERD